MRTLKFRAWLGKSEYYNRIGMFEVFSLSQITHEIIVDDLITAIHEKYLKIMQYTGLKDKNGVEIYEGDIYRYGKHILKVEWDEGNASYGDLTSMQSERRLLMGLNEKRAIKDKDCIQVKDIEVIGNIYENPELMEGKR